MVLTVIDAKLTLTEQLPPTFMLLVSTLPPTFVVTFVVADDSEVPDELRLRLPLPPCMLPEVLTLVFVLTLVVADEEAVAPLNATESCYTLPLIVPDPAAEPPTVPEFVNAAPES